MIIQRYLGAALLLLFSCEAFATCENQQGLLSKPQPGEVKSCLYSIRHDLGRGNEIDSAFVGQFIEVLLPGETASRYRLENLGALDINYYLVAEIISLLKSEQLIEIYLDFIVDTSGSADESRSFGLGRLYTLQAPPMIRLLEARNRDEQATIVTSLSWGLVNNFYPHMTENNFRRLIVGEYWELLDPTNRSDVQIWIESVVQDMLSVN